MCELCAEGRGVFNLACDGCALRLLKGAHNVKAVAEHIRRSCGEERLKRLRELWKGERGEA